MSLDPQLQAIYNSYLRNCRKNLPFKYRKNFNNLNENLLNVLFKLNSFFKKYHYIDIDDFFNAPNIVYPNEKYPYIDFFIKRQAIKAYQLSLKEKKLKPIQEQLLDIKKSLKFIADFCLLNKISLKDYSVFKNENSHMPYWSTHYREHKLNVYSLIDVIDWREFDNLTQDEKEIWFPGLQNDLQHCKIQYNNSPEIKSKIKNIINKLNTITTKI